MVSLVFSETGMASLLYLLCFFTACVTSNRQNPWGKVMAFPRRCLHTMVILIAGQVNGIYHSQE